MNRIFEGFDRAACIGDLPTAAKWLDRIAFIFLALMVATCPHSIAASEISWLAGLVVTAIRFALRPRPAFRVRTLDIALITLFLWSAVTAVFSYDPATSLDRLRGVSLFLVFVFVSVNLRGIRSVWFLGFLLVISCTVNAFREPVSRVLGRGVEIHGLDPNGPLARSGFADGDTLLKVNGIRINDPEKLLDALRQNDTVTVDMHRPDMYDAKRLERSGLLPGIIPNERLGFSEWHPSHYWRATGFFRHWITYSEALQLIISLTFGLLQASFLYRKQEDAASTKDRRTGRIAGIATSKPVLIACFASMCAALLLTATRASQLSFLISAFVMSALSMKRKYIIAAVLVALPIGAVGLYLLQQSRQVGFFDSKDESTLYRMTMWKDGMRLWTSWPRNFLLGIGMDSKDKHWREWNMYDNGRLPVGHFHSTYVQLTVERGLPALLIWLAIIAIYLRILWIGLHGRHNRDRRTMGILLGGFGGTCGFAISGIVHSNVIDAAVVLIFYLVMGLSVRAAELASKSSENALTEST